MTHLLNKKNKLQMHIQQVTGYQNALKSQIKQIKEHQNTLEDLKNQINLVNKELLKKKIEHFIFTLNQHI